LRGFGGAASAVRPGRQQAPDQESGEQHKSEAGEPPQSAAPPRRRDARRDDRRFARHVGAHRRRRFVGAIHGPQSGVADEICVWSFLEKRKKGSSSFLKKRTKKRLPIGYMAHFE
jgi:hypothetical protein